MRKFLKISLVAAALLPVAVSAQTSELRRDRQDVREEQRELRQAQARGDRGDIRDQRDDVRDARQELREDRRDYRRDEWRSYRNDHRGTYARGNWHAPYRYQTFRVGGRIAPRYYSPRYVISDPWRYRLPRAQGYARWVRHYDDVLLVNIRTGIVRDVIRGVFW